jgi:hypothetical protein
LHKGDAYNDFKCSQRKRVSYSPLSNFKRSCFVGSYDPETLGFSSQIDAHCLHIKQDAHRLLYPTEGCISIQQSPLDLPEGCRDTLVEASPHHDQLMDRQTDRGLALLEQGVGVVDKG